ncbi:MAG: PolC-type DNA polymerase III N-terminal domain-containing protein, partial [Clostridiaceae bacterium]
MKRINEIFSDYEAGGNITTAIVESVVLIKKSRRLEIKINSDKYIEPREFEELNRFIRRRFALEDSAVSVTYADGTEIKPVESELKKIITLLAEKHPAWKTALNNCEYQFENNTINFNFKIEVSGFFKSMNYDKQLLKTIKNLYGTTYKINFVDDVSSEDLILQKEAREKEMLAISREITTALKNNAPKLPEETAPKKSESKAETSDEKTPSSLIVGRSTKINQSAIKIVDITPDEGRIVLSGEISNIESRDLRSGKTLVSFDLYD